ncbi:7697_t:CDS:2, partial [Racocetra fulgida]
NSLQRTSSIMKRCQSSDVLESESDEPEYDRNLWNTPVEDVEERVNNKENFSDMLVEEQAHYEEEIFSDMSVEERAHYKEENFSDMLIEESLKDSDSPSIIEDTTQLILNELQTNFANIFIDNSNEAYLNTENISSDLEDIQGATIDDALDSIEEKINLKIWQKNIQKILNEKQGKEFSVHN